MAPSARTVLASGVAAAVMAIDAAIRLGNRMWKFINYLANLHGV